MGCAYMGKLLYIANITKKDVARYIHVVSPLILIALYLVFFSLIVSASSFIPATPDGPDVGFLNIEYTYTIYTTSPDAEWMFEWGDGMYTPWLTVGVGNDSIAQSHSWSSKGIYQVRVKFRNSYFTEGIWSHPLPVTISHCEPYDFPHPPASIAGEKTACVNVSNVYSASAHDPQGNKVQLRFYWGDTTFSEWSSFVASGTLVSFDKKWSKAGTYSIIAQARDQYGLVSGWSEPYEIQVDADSDADMISDSLEQHFCSNPFDSTDVQCINADVGFFSITTQSGTTLFYDVHTKKTSVMEISAAGLYLIDTNDDGVWDYHYDSLSGVLTDYVFQESESQHFEIPWIVFVISGGIGGILLIIAVLIKTGYIYIYEEYIIEK